MSKHPYTAISEHSLVKGTPSDIEAWLMSLQPDSPVNHSASRDNKQARTTPVICGQPQSNAYALYDRRQRYWKTSQVCLLFGNDGSLSLYQIIRDGLGALRLKSVSPPISDEYLQTWPKAGMMQNGECWPRPRLEPGKVENAYGYWPTPTVNGNNNRKGISAKAGDGLSTAVKYATPQSRDFRTGESHRWEGKERSRNLNDQAAAMSGYKIYLTPRASEYKGVGPLGSKSHKHMLDKGYLCADVQEVGNETGQLNPDWVEWLMGWPRGWTSLEKLTDIVWPSWANDPHPDPPRTKKGIADRASRIKALGNGQVPQVVKAAWELLSN